MGQFYFGGQYSFQFINFCQKSTQKTMIWQKYFGTFSNMNQMQLINQIIMINIIYFNIVFCTSLACSSRWFCIHAQKMMLFWYVLRPCFCSRLICLSTTFSFHFLKGMSESIHLRRSFPWHKWLCLYDGIRWVFTLHWWVLSVNTSPFTLYHQYHILSLFVSLLFILEDT